MSTWRRLVRRGAPVLVLTLALGLALPHPVEAGDWDVVGKVWSWFVELWSADGERGGGLDPNGATREGDRTPRTGPQMTELAG